MANTRWTTHAWQSPTPARRLDRPGAKQPRALPLECPRWGHLELIPNGDHDVCRVSAVPKGHFEGRARGCFAPGQSRRRASVGLCQACVVHLVFAISVIHFPGGRPAAVFAQTFCPTTCRGGGRRMDGGLRPCRNSGTAWDALSESNLLLLPSLSASPPPAAAPPCGPRSSGHGHRGASGVPRA